MATTKKLVIEVDTPKGGSKKFEFNNPKSGLTKANAETFVESLYDNNTLDPNTIGTAGELIDAYYLETTITQLT